MHLQHIPHTHIDAAWRAGAERLGVACERSGGEMTGSQLKTLLARGEFVLLAVCDDAGPRGWLAVQVQQHPNLRVLHVAAIHAPGATGDIAFARLREYASREGCSSIRGACGPAVGKLWARRFAARPIYTIMEMPV